MVLFLDEMVELIEEHQGKELACLVSKGQTGRRVDVGT